MSERTAIIIGLSWIVTYLATGALLLMGVILVSYFPVIWCSMALPVLALFLLVTVVSAMSGDDDDPDDDDVFLSRAYSMFDCNVWHETDYPDQEDDDD